MPATAAPAPSCSISRQVCACLVAMGQVAGRTVETVEGLGDGNGTLAALQTSFLAHGAAQCGICTPGMLMAAQELLAQDGAADARRGRGCAGRRALPLHRLRQDRRCRHGCDGIAARRAAGRRRRRCAPGAGRRRQPSLSGREKFGADGVPADALWIRVVRSPHARARFTLGDLEPLRQRLAAVLTAADVPSNGFGIYPDIKDQPVLADGQVRYRGEAVVALVGERDVVLAIRDEEVPITWTPEPPVVGLDAAMAADAPLVQADKPRNLLLEGGVRRGKVGRSLRDLRRGGRGRVRDRLRRARLYRARGRLGRARGRSHRNPCLDPDALHGPRRGGDRHAAAARGGAHRADGLRRRLRRQARPLGPAAGGGGGVEASAGRSPWSTRGRRAWRPRPSAIPRASPPGSAAMPRAGCSPAR